MHRSHYLLLVLVCIAALAGRAPGQDAAKDSLHRPTTVGQPADTSLTREVLQGKMMEVEKDANLDEAIKSKLLEALKLALSQVDAADTHRAAKSAFQQQAQSAPQQTQAIRDALTKAPPLKVESVVLSPEMTAADAEQLLSSAQADHTAAANRAADIEARLKAMTTRPNEAREAIITLKKKLEDLDKQLQTPAPPDETPALTEARRLSLSALKLATQAELEKLEQELLTIDARQALLTAERDQAARQLAEADLKVKALQTALNERRQQEAEMAEREAARILREAMGKHPAVVELANTNAELSQELKRITAEAEKATSARQTAGDELKQIEQDYQDAKKKIEVAGLSETLGRILRDQRNRLPNLKRYQRSASERSRLIGEMGLAQIQIDEKRRALVDPETTLASLMANRVEATLSAKQRSVIEEELRKLLATQQELLTKLSSIYSSYMKSLGDLDFAQTQLMARAGEYARYLDERLLWIPSVPVVSGATFKQAAVDVAWLTSGDAWGATYDSLAAELTARPVVSALALAALLALLLGRRKLLRWESEGYERIGKPLQDRFLFTIRVLIVTALLAATFPLPFLIAGALLRDSLTAPLFARAAGAALAEVSWVALILLFIKELCDREGLAEAHLGWSTHATSVLRKQLRWFIPALVPAVMLVTLAEWQIDEAHRRGLGRLAFVVMMMFHAVFLALVVRPRRGALGAVVAAQPESMLTRTRYLWSTVAVAIPVILAVLALVGYLYTALQLHVRFVATLGILFCAVFTYWLLMRWVTLAQTRLAIWRARQRLQEQAQRAKTEEEDDDAPKKPRETAPIDIATINEQTRHFLFGIIATSFILALWAIWAGVLPALGILDNVEVWNRMAVVQGQMQVVPVTLKDLGLAFIVGMLTFVAARNLPGALEITVLRRLNVDPGTRYAVSSISRYVIVAIGIVIAFGAIGVGWPEVQWLLAALTVGLGFGLQEIFANFISGLIILVERPVRVGDTVTVGGISGVVTRIRIRATTITDWNQKELIVPNKRFITEDVVNWTLSDAVTRLDIPVGIAYGSDTTLALKTLQEVARGLPNVQAHPEPEVFFLGFGDNSLNFEVRVFVREMTNKARTMVIHALHMAIDEAFRKHNIVIAFPQRDIHIHNTGEPFTVRLAKDGSAPSGTGA